MTKPSRSIATAMLVLACALLSADFLALGHDDEDFDGHDHHCTLCCLREHATGATAVEPPGLAAPVPLALVAASPRHRRGFPTAPDPHPTRGPPA